MDSTTNQKIGLFTATIVGMNALIGAGVFTTVATLASSVGPAAILTYLFVILAVICMALTLSRVAGQFPEEGSFYQYAKQWGGHRAGVIAATSYIIGLCIAMGLISQVAGFYLHTWLPGIPVPALSIITLLALIILNMIGVTLSKAGQFVLICCTTFPLLATTLVGFFHADFNNLTPFMPYSPSNLIAATKDVIFGFFGFECAASLFAVVKDPQRNVPRAITLAILFVGAIYLAFVTSIILSVPLSNFTDPTIALSTVIAKAFPGYKWLANLIHFSVISAILGTLHSMIWSVSALVVSFTKQLKIGSLPFFKKRTDLENLRWAVAGVGIVILLSAVSISSINLFFSITALCLVLSYVMGMGAIFTTKQSPLQLAISIIGFVTAGVILLAAIQGLIQSFFSLS